jgi:hypothetical protein
MRFELWTSKTRGITAPSAPLSQAQLNIVGMKHHKYGKKMSTVYHFQRFEGQRMKQFSAT